MRIVAHDVAVLAGARFGFVRIDDKVMRTAVAFLRHEGPFQPGREPCPAAAAQARRLHLVDDPVTALFEDLLGAVPVAARHRTLQRLVIDAIDIGENPVFVS